MQLKWTDVCLTGGVYLCAMALSTFDSLRFSTFVVNEYVDGSIFGELLMMLFPSIAVFFVVQFFIRNNISSRSSIMGGTMRKAKPIFFENSTLVLVFSETFEKLATFTRELLHKGSSMVIRYFNSCEGVTHWNHVILCFLAWQWDEKSIFILSTLRGT